MLAEVWASFRPGVEAGDRLDRELTVKRLELFEVAPVLRSAGEPLEADDTAKAGDTGRLSASFGIDRMPVDGLVVEGRQAAPHDVDDSVLAANTDVVSVEDIIETQGLTVVKASCLHALEKADDRLVGLAAIGHEQIRVLWSPAKSRWL